MSYAAIILNQFDLFDLFLFFIVPLVCMLVFTVFTIREGRSWGYISTLWGCFVVLVVIGLLMLSQSIIMEYRHWMELFSDIAKTYATTIQEMEHWQIKQGDPRIFSDWSKPLEIPSENVNIGELTIESPFNSQDAEKLAVPGDFSILILDNNRFRVKWNRVPGATTYRLQWTRFKNRIQELAQQGKTNSQNPTTEKAREVCNQGNIYDTVEGWSTCFTGDNDEFEFGLNQDEIPNVFPLRFRIRAENGTPTTHPNYRTIARFIERCVKQSPYTKYIYSVRYIDDKHSMFIMDPDLNLTEKADDVRRIDSRFCAIGECYLLSRALNETFQNHKLTIQTEGVSDEWGNWTTVSIPMFEPDGSFDAILCTDYDTQSLCASINTSKHYPTLFFISTMVLFFAGVALNMRLHYYAHSLRATSDVLKANNAELIEAKQKAERLGQVKTQFLANISHEIRTPMNAIVVMSGLLMEEKMTTKQANYVSDIKRSADSLLTIINDLLDFSKLETGKMELFPKHYRFFDMLESIASTLGFIAKKKGISFEIIKQGTIPKYIFGDATRLKQVIWNLVGNAMKFTDSGQVTLTISDTGTELKFEIADTGIGIREEDIPKLLEAFVQIDQRSSASNKGTGLGLSISRNIVEFMGGKISIKSVYGKGSTFTFVIPKIEGQPPETVVEDKHELIYQSDADILVVDDNMINLNVAAGVFGSLGISITTADSGRAAIKLVQQKDFDIIFMDHMMPELDGIEAMQLIRAMGNEFLTKPIITLTANAVQGAKEMFLRAGFNDFISKPINKIELNGVLVNWLPKNKYKTRVPMDSVVDAKKKREDDLRALLMEHLPDLNIEHGLENTGEDWEIWMSALEMLVSAIPDDCQKMREMLENRNLEGFQVYVQGVKGALMGTGFGVFASKAARIEQAAREKNMAFCDENLPQLIQNLENIVPKLSAILDEAKFGD
ncbi:MAG: ATP-binding protein [Thermoguttaceae bacterium]